MEENKNAFTKEEIEEAAKKFVDDMFAEMKAQWPDQICPACGAVNCHFNETCIKCNCQL
jgi:hypothetical protein